MASNDTSKILSYFASLWRLLDHNFLKRTSWRLDDDLLTWTWRRPLYRNLMMTSWQQLDDDLRTGTWQPLDRNLTMTSGQDLGDDLWTATRRLDIIRAAVWVKNSPGKGEDDSNNLTWERGNPSFFCPKNAGHKRRINVLWDRWVATRFAAGEEVSDTSAAVEGVEGSNTAAVWGRK